MVAQLMIGPSSALEDAISLKLNYRLGFNGVYYQNRKTARLVPCKSEKKDEFLPHRHPPLFRPSPPRYWLVYIAGRVRRVRPI